MFGFADFCGYTIVTVAVIILLAVFFVQRRQEEEFIDFQGLTRKVVDKFETTFFSPELTKVGEKAGIMVKGEPNEAAPVLKPKEPSVVPDAVNISRPDVCDPTVMKCTGTKIEPKGPLKFPPPPDGNPYGNVPIGQLDYTGFRDLAKDLKILRGAPKTLPGGKSAAECKFVSGDSCPEGYNLVGASIGITGSGAKLQCNGSTVDIPAVLQVDVHEESGKVRRIVPINGGRGYKSNPAVLIKGAGQGATARAFINDAGSIEVVEILNPGTGYKSGTTVAVTNADQDSDTCQLCCRL